MALSIKRYLLATSVPLGGTGGLEGLGPLGNEGNLLPWNEIRATMRFDQVLSIAVGVLTVSAAIWFMTQIIIASIQWLSAGSDKNAVQNAAKRFLNSVVGLMLVVLSLILSLTIGAIFGFNILEPGAIILNRLFP